jgi:hypothetical protein
LQPEELGLVRTFFDKDWTLKSEKEGTFKDNTASKESSSLPNNAGMSASHEENVQLSQRKKEVNAFQSMSIPSLL